ncbi:MAG: DUF4260 domain-containing protein [Anaerolineae bacterium]|nr:DUF4260 domain-containing protein [Anaerolineae bacterium]
MNISMPSLWLRLEGLTLFIGAIALYAHLGFNGWWFLVLLLTPDLTMIGYLRNPQIGAFTYNLAHNYALPLALLAITFATTWQTGIMLGLIWVAHISMDRVVGYGLKYGSNFKDTHLQKL